MTQGKWECYFVCESGSSSSVNVTAIDTKAKCCHLKKFTCKGTLRQVFICPKRPPLLMTPYPPLHTVTFCPYTRDIFAETRTDNIYCLKIFTKLVTFVSDTFFGSGNFSREIRILAVWHMAGVVAAGNQDIPGKTRTYLGNQDIPVYVYAVYLFTPVRGGWGRVQPQRKVRGATVQKLGRKCRHDWLYLQYINYDKHLPQSPFTGKFFRWRHFALVSMLRLICKMPRSYSSCDPVHQCFYYIHKSVLGQEEWTELQ